MSQILVENQYCAHKLQKHCKLTAQQSLSRSFILIQTLPKKEVVSHPKTTRPDSPGRGRSSISARPCVEMYWDPQRHTVILRPGIVGKLKCLTANGWRLITCGAERIWDEPAIGDILCLLTGRSIFDNKPPFARCTLVNVFVNVFGERGFYSVDF